MISGRCECGSVSYHADSEVSDYSHCHCSQCRRLHGAAFASFAGVKRAALQIDSGQPQLKRYASSQTHHRVFCSNCGSSMFVELASEPDDIYLALGTVDGNPPLPPGYHIYVGSKAPWYTILDNQPQYDTEPEY